MWLYIRTLDLQKNGNLKFNLALKVFCIGKGNWKIQRQHWLQALFDSKNQKKKRRRKDWSEEITENEAQTSTDVENIKDWDVTA